MCVICSEGGGNFQCPADSLQRNGTEVYHSFFNLVKEFTDLDAMPVELDFKGCGTVQAFEENKAKWHKACHLKCQCGGACERTEANHH